MMSGVVLSPVAGKARMAVAGVAAVPVMVGVGSVTSGAMPVMAEASSVLGAVFCSVGIVF